MLLADQVNKVFSSYAEIATKQPDAIALLHSVYKTIFGENVKKGCGNCNLKAFRAIHRHIISQQEKNKDFNLETMKEFKDRNFVLAKGKQLQTEFNGTMLTNDNMTDDAAIKLLTKFPNLVKHFSKYPKDDEGNLVLDLPGIVLDNEDNANVVNMPAPVITGDAAQTDVAPVIAGDTAQAAAPVIIQPVADAVKVPVINADKAAINPAKPEVYTLNAGETIKQAAERYGVSDRTIQRSIKSQAKAAKGKNTVTVLPDNVETQTDVAPVIIEEVAKPGEVTEAVNEATEATQVDEAIQGPEHTDEANTGAENV